MPALKSTTKVPRPDWKTLQPQVVDLFKVAVAIVSFYNPVSTVSQICATLIGTALKLFFKAKVKKTAEVMFKKAMDDLLLCLRGRRDNNFDCSFFAMKIRSHLFNYLLPAPSFPLTILCPALFLLLLLSFVCLYIYSFSFSEFKLLI